MVNLISFSTVDTKASFNSLASKDPNTFYYIEDTQEVFKGDKSYTQSARIVTDLPATPALGIIYIKSSSSEAFVWDGTNWNTVFQNKIDDTTLSTINNSVLYTNLKKTICGGQALAGAILDTANWSISVPIGSTGLYSYIVKTISSTDIIGMNMKVIITVTRPASLSSWGYYFSPVFKHGTTAINPTSSSDIDTVTKKYVYTVTNIQSDISFSYQNVVAMPTTDVRVFKISSMYMTISGASTTTNNTDNLYIALGVNNSALKTELGLTATKKTIIKVKKDGTGDFTNPYLATESVKASSNSSNTYDIELYDDEYDIISYLPSSMVTNPSDSYGNRGWEIPNYVNIIGKTINKCHIKGELPDTCTNAQSTALSTINLAQNSNLENLYVTAKNMRYAVHDESSGYYKNWTRGVKNCKFEHLGNASGLWLYQGAWGEGCSSGSQSTFENCEFIGNSGGCGWSTHNNSSFTIPSVHIFKNCKFNNSSSNGVALRFGSMGSGQVDKVELIGCEIPDLSIKEELNNGCGIDFKVSGHSNNMPIYSVNNTTTKFYDFIEETMEMYNSDTTSIAKGSLVKLDQSNSVKKISTSDNVNVVFGFAAVDIPIGSKGIVKYNGYINLTDISIKANIGDKIGLTNGIPTVVTSGEYFAKVVYSGYAKFMQGSISQNSSNNSPKCCFEINIEDYSSYATGQDYSAALNYIITNIVDNIHRFIIHFEQNKVYTLNCPINKKYVTLTGGATVNGNLTIGLSDTEMTASWYDTFIGCVIQNLSFIPNTDWTTVYNNTTQGIWLKNARDVRIHNCIFKNMVYPIKLLTRQNSLVQHSNCIYVSDCTFFNVSYNLYAEKATSDTLDGIFEYGDLSFQNNLCQATKVQNILLHRTDGFMCQGNTFFNEHGNCIISLAKSTIINITNNQLFEPGSYGILLENIYVANINNNNIYWAGKNDNASGIKISGENLWGDNKIMATINGNIIEKPYGNGIEILKSSKNIDMQGIVVSNNIVYLRDNTKTPMKCDSNGLAIIINNNVCTGNTSRTDIGGYAVSSNNGVFDDFSSVNINTSKQWINNSGSIPSIKNCTNVIFLTNSQASISITDIAPDISKLNEGVEIVFCNTSTKSHTINYGTKLITKTGQNITISPKNIVKFIYFNGVFSQI